MNEAETRAELIDPALAAAGWGVASDTRVRREVICPGRIMGGGRRGEPTTADYVLTFRNHKLAVVEAKAAGAGVSAGLGQAKVYADKLKTRFAFSTDGAGLYQVDMRTGAEGPVERWPTPEELWETTFEEPNAWRMRFAAVPWREKPGGWSLRYYQQIAAERALEAIARGDDRLLLTLATGTGKTTIAFEIVWKLFEARWNLDARDTANGAGGPFRSAAPSDPSDRFAATSPRMRGEALRRPRVLFLADRNGLADQAYNDFTSFNALEERALARVRPEEIRKTGGVPKNAAVFFTIFQTFSSGRDDALGRPEGFFGDYPADFFDLIIIDECHRGGAQDEGRWRNILEYFEPAVQLGLTATPKRKVNADTYAYFGEPLYTYSLKEGIQDGFLTPFKVRQIGTTMDEYLYTSDDEVVAGSVEEGRRYVEGEFNRVIEIPEREKARVGIFMNSIGPLEKTLVFCASQDHARAVRDYVNQTKTIADPHYCERVTADDGEIGDRWLRQFQDNEKTIPAVLTTSQKLSTGVDARNVRHIVLLRPVNSMVEFKQIIGRGTRLYEGKDYFTIHDFVGAHRNFSDPEWDGEPAEPEAPAPKGAPGDGAPAPRDPAEREPRPERIVIKLADGKARTIQHIAATSFWGPDGRPMSAREFIERLYGELPALFGTEAELRALWGDPASRQALLADLGSRGFTADALAEMRRVIDAQDSDIFDVLAFVAFALAPVTRAERVSERRESALGCHDPRLRAFLDFVLGQYVEQGVEELGRDRLGRLLELRYGSVLDAAEALGDAGTISGAFVDMQRRLFV